MFLVQKIAMDFAVHGVTPRVYGKQNDYKSRCVLMSLFDNGTALAASDTWKFSLNYKTPSGKSGMYDKLPDGSLAFSVSSGGDIAIFLAPQIFAEAGATACELSIVDSTGGVSTWTFLVIVEASAQGGDPVPEDYYNSFLGIAADAAAAADRATAAANSVNANNLMQKSIYDSSGEVAAAGGIAAFIANAANLKFESGTYTGDGNSTGYKQLTFGFNPLVVFVQATDIRSPVIVFVRGMYHATHRPDCTYYRSVHLNLIWQSSSLHWVAGTTYVSTDFNGTVEKNAPTAGDNLNELSHVYQWAAIGL